MAVFTTGGAYAQNPCSSTPQDAHLNGDATCIPLTYKPADGGPERTVWLPSSYPPLVGLSGGPVAAPVLKPPVPRFEIGAMGTFLNPDYNAGRNETVGGFAAFTTRYIGAEIDGSAPVHEASGIHETTVVAGPRIQYPTKYVTVYIKAQAGYGSFSGTGQAGTNYLVEQYGGGVDFRVLKHIEIRAADLSYQIWPSFSRNGLTPLALSAGIGFAF